MAENLGQTQPGQYRKAAAQTRTPPLPNLVERPRLVKRLDEGLRLGHRLTLIIATREDPDLPLAPLRVSDQLTELRATDLRFTSSEAAEFLNWHQQDQSVKESFRVEGRLACNGADGDRLRTYLVRSDHC